MWHARLQWVKIPALVRHCLRIFPLWYQPSFLPNFLLLYQYSSSYFTPGAPMPEVSCIGYTPRAWNLRSDSPCKMSPFISILWNDFLLTKYSFNYLIIIIIIHTPYTHYGVYIYYTLYNHLNMPCKHAYTDTSMHVYGQCVLYFQIILNVCYIVW